MLSCFTDLRGRLLLLTIAIMSGVIWTVLATYYPNSISKASIWYQINDVGDVRDPIRVEDLLSDDATLNVETLSERFSVQHWAEVESIAVKFLAQSPLNSRTWFILALARAAQHKSTVEVAAALKMSYYSGPTDIAIMKVRLAFSVQLTFEPDPELVDMIKREVRNIILGPPGLRNILIDAYCRALPEGRAVIAGAAYDLQGGAEDTWDKGC
jgi:hypothetical protein